jgi:two-component system, cell cycle sensor histidine kinase PleC
VESQHSKTQQGTGLGLALTKALTEMHGGSLQIESEPGRGTLVSIVLPVRQTRAAVVAA